MSMFWKILNFCFPISQHLACLFSALSPFLGIWRHGQKRLGNGYILETPCFLCTGKMAVSHPLIGKGQQKTVWKCCRSIRNSKGKIIFCTRLFPLSAFITPYLLVCLFLMLTLSLFFPCGREAWWAWCKRVGRRVKAGDMLWVEFQNPPTPNCQFTIPQQAVIMMCQVMTFSGVRYTDWQPNLHDSTPYHDSLQDNE